MATTIASVATTCYSCGATARLAFSDVFVYGVLRYWESFHCPTCGRQHEADGLGRLPEELRAHAIAHRAVRIDASASVPRLAALRAMRVLFGVTIHQAPTRWASILAGELMTVAEAQQMQTLIPGLVFVEQTGVEPT